MQRLADPRKPAVSTKSVWAKSSLHPLSEPRIPSATPTELTKHSEAPDPPALAGPAGTLREQPRVLRRGATNDDTLPLCRSLEHELKIFAAIRAPEPFLASGCTTAWQIRIYAPPHDIILSATRDDIVSVGGLRRPSRFNALRDCIPAPGPLFCWVRYPPG